MCLKACESEYHICDKSEIIYDSRKISSGVNLALDTGTLSSSTNTKHKSPTKCKWSFPRFFLKLSDSCTNYKNYYVIDPALLELLVLRVCQRSSPHQGSVMVAKDVLLNPEHSFNMVLEQWSSQMAGFAYKMQSLQLDMAEFACVNAIMLFEQGDYFLDLDAEWPEFQTFSSIRFNPPRFWILTCVLVGIFTRRS